MLRVCEEQVVTAACESPLGTLLLGESGGKLRFLLFPPWEMPAGAAMGSSPLLDEAGLWLERYFSGRDPGALPPCEPWGTPFQRRVWEALSRVPWGETRSYGQLARELGTAARAVGGALNKNPLPIFLPCHRILGADGSLTGFSDGLDIKRKLLELELIL